MTDRGWRCYNPLWEAPWPLSAASYSDIFFGQSNKATFQTHSLSISDPVVRDSTPNPLNISIWEDQVVKHSGRWLGRYQHMHNAALPTFQNSFFNPGSNIPPRRIDKRLFPPRHLKSIEVNWPWVGAWVEPSIVVFQNTWRVRNTCSLSDLFPGYFIYWMAEKP